MRSAYTIFFLFFFSGVFAQKVDDLDRYRIDTLRTGAYLPPKVIAFTHGELQFFLDFGAFSDSALLFAKNFRRTDKRQATLVATLLSKARRSFRDSDTAWMMPEAYNFIGFYFVERFVCAQIDKGTIAIRLTSDLTVINEILRVAGSFIRGPLNAWSGRRYYLPGRDRYFAMVTTSQS